MDLSFDEEKILLLTYGHENNNLTRERVRSYLAHYMETLHQSNLIYDYRVVCDDSNNPPFDNDTLAIDVYFRSASSLAKVIRMKISMDQFPFTLEQEDYHEC